MVFLTGMRWSDFMKSSHIQAWPYISWQDFNMWKWTGGSIIIYMSKGVQKIQGVFGEK